MAKSILSVAPTATQNTPQYQLDPQARQAILARSDSARKNAKIERQRLAFSAKNFGCEFGLKTKSKIKK